MRSRMSVQYLLLGMLAACCLLSASLVQAAANVAEFKKVHGVVDVFHAGERKASPVALGGTVRVGDIVRTGRRSRAQLKFTDGSVLNIGSLAKIEIGEFSYDADKKVRKSSIRNLRGKVRAAVSKVHTQGSYFKIRTPGALAAVRGTNFAVDVVSPTVTVVVTFEGSVAVGNLNALQPANMVLVQARQMTRVIARQPPSPPVTAPPAVMKNMVRGTKQAAAAPAGGSATTGTVATTTTQTTGKTTATGVSTTTTTTTVSDAGTTSVSTTSNAGVPLATAAAPVAVAPVVVAPVINIPPPVTPPITTVVPAVQNANVNVVIVF